MQAGMSVSLVARRAGVAPSLLFKWRRLLVEGGHQAVRADEDVVGTSQVRDLERRVRELERLLGRKTMEVEILREALNAARVKNRYCSCNCSRIARTVPNENRRRHLRSGSLKPGRTAPGPSPIAGPVLKE